MKKKFSIFVSMLVLIVSLISTVPIYAATIEDYDDAYEEAFAHGYTARVDDGIGFKLNSGSVFSFPMQYVYHSDTQESFRLVSTQFTVSCGSKPVYGVFLRSNSCLIPLLVSESSFTINYVFANEYYKFINEDGVSSRTGDDTRLAQQSFSVSQYNGFYFASFYAGFYGTWDDYVQISLPTYDIPVQASSDVSAYAKKFIDMHLADSLPDAVVRGEDGEDVPVYDLPSSLNYNSDLGFLQNIQCTTLVDKTNVTNTPNEYAGDKKYKFSYGLTTSSGFDLRSDGADVQYVIKIKGGYTTLTNNYVSLNTVVSDYYKVGHGLSYYYLESSTLNDLYGRFRNDASLMAKTIDSQIFIYMRPISRTSSGAFYGGWSRIKFDKGNIQVSNLHIDNGTTPDGSISSESDGEDDNFNVISSSDGQSSYGEGNGFDDAESNARPSGTNSSNTTIDYDADAMMNNLRGLVAQVGQIPLIISDIFSFLPSWCLTLFGVGFALVVFLIIYKLIRG